MKVMNKYVNIPDIDKVIVYSLNEVERYIASASVDDILARFFSTVVKHTEVNVSDGVINKVNYTGISNCKVELHNGEFTVVCKVSTDGVVEAIYGDCKVTVSLSPDAVKKLDNVYLKLMGIYG